MLYIYMPFYGRRRTRMVAVKRPTSARKYTPRRKNYNKKPQVSFTSKVQKIISSNVENKLTTNNHMDASVCSLSGGTSGTADWFLFTPSAGATPIFKIGQGTDVQSRTGNQIKLKRWVIKGLIQPFGVGVIAGGGNTQMGYVDIYFGRLLNNNAPVSNLLPDFYQNGATNMTPYGTAAEQLYKVNADKYKIYYHRRFKLGVGNGFQSQSLTSAPVTYMPQANDFKLATSFGFDVCKYVCKNRIIKYSDSSIIPEDNMINNLSLWAVWHPVSSDMGPLTSGSTYNINVTSHAEFEDA